MAIRMHVIHWLVAHAVFWFITTKQDSVRRWALFFTIMVLANNLSFCSLTARTPRRTAYFLGTVLSGRTIINGCRAKGLLRRHALSSPSKLTSLVHLQPSYMLETHGLDFSLFILDLLLDLSISAGCNRTVQTLPDRFPSSCYTCFPKLLPVLRLKT